MSNKPLLIIIGSGGHASVLLDILLSQSQEVVAYVSPDPANNKKLFKGIIHISSDADIEAYPANEVLLVNGIGHMPNCNLRSRLYNSFLSKGYQFTSVISQNAVISKYSKISEDAQILAGAIVQVGASIGNNSIINTSVIVEHDSEIKDHVHLAPNVTVCGNSVINSHCFIGASATIIQGLVIGQNSVVGAGVTILQNITKETFISLKRKQCD